MSEQDISFLLGFDWAIITAIVLGILVMSGALERDVSLVRAWVKARVKRWRR